MVAAMSDSDCSEAESFRFSDEDDDVEMTQVDDDNNDNPTGKSSVNNENDYMSEEEVLPDLPSLVPKGTGDALAYRSLPFPAGVRKEIAKAADHVTEVTALPAEDAQLVLREYQWDINIVTEKYFSKPEELCSKVGINVNENPVAPRVGASSSSSSSSTAQTTLRMSDLKQKFLADFNKKYHSKAPSSQKYHGQGTSQDSSIDRRTSGMCPICFEDVTDSLVCLPCEHRFCKECWSGHVDSAVRDGATCLNLRCMAPGCQERVRWNMLQEFCSTQDLKDRAANFADRAFVDFNPKCKWCPKPDCPNVVLVKDNIKTVETMGVAFLSSGTRKSANGNARSSGAVTAGKKSPDTDDEQKSGKSSKLPIAPYSPDDVDMNGAKKVKLSDDEDLHPKDKDLSHISRKDLYCSQAEERLPCREVICSTCEMKWCFCCNQEAHRGISCRVVRRWLEKNQDEAENVTWIIANTKPCPKCKYPIQKNQGCMHMVCRCGHQFCWLCLADDYNYSHTRDGRPCNTYLEPDMQKELSRKNLARYAHYFERFRAHQQAQQIAEEKTLPEVKVRMEELFMLFREWTDVLFLEAAIRQVIECRRLLKWSYAFAFFHDDITLPYESPKATARPRRGGRPGREGDRGDPIRDYLRWARDRADGIEGKGRNEWVPAKGKDGMKGMYGRPGLKGSLMERGYMGKDGEKGKGKDADIFGKGKGEYMAIGKGDLYGKGTWLENGKGKGKGDLGVGPEDMINLLNAELNQMEGVVARYREQIARLEGNNAGFGAPVGNNADAVGNNAAALANAVTPNAAAPNAAAAPRREVDDLVEDLVEEILGPGAPKVVAPSGFFEFQQGQLEQKVDQLQALFEGSSFIKDDVILEEVGSTVIPTSEASSSPNGTSSSMVGARGAAAAGGPKSSIPLVAQDPAAHEARKQQFFHFKAELTNLTQVVNTFFQNICEFFEQISQDQNEDDL